VGQPIGKVFLASHGRPLLLALLVLILLEGARKLGPLDSVL
jgi:hypothetical protein